MRAIIVLVAILVVTMYLVIFVYPRYGEFKRVIPAETNLGKVLCSNPADSCAVRKALVGFLDSLLVTKDITPLQYLGISYANGMDSSGNPTIKRLLTDSLFSRKPTLPPETLALVIKEVARKKVAKWSSLRDVLERRTDGATATEQLIYAATYYLNPTKER